MRTVEEYKDLMEKKESEIRIQKAKWNEAKEKEETASIEAHKKEEALQIEQKGYDRRNAEKPWTVSIIAIVGCVLGICYFMFRGFNATAEDELQNMIRVSIFLFVVILLLIGLGILRTYLKKKELATKEEVMNGIRAKKANADEKYAEAIAAREKEESAFHVLETTRIQLQAEMDRDHPEEKERLQKEKEADMKRRLAEKEAQDAAYQKMVEEREEQNKRIQLAEEMFDAPKKFLREYDGNEFKVVLASAELGCEDAKRKAVMVYVGAEYVPGATVDCDAGIALAKKYSANGKDGSPAVAEAMGEIYLFGKGRVEKDAEKAIPWLTIAAKCGKKNSMVNLGYCYYAGEGVENDVEKAKFWFEKAVKQGDEQAFRLLEAINSGREIVTDGDDE